MAEPQPPSKASITDSPWYWVYLFATAGLIVLMMAGSRYSLRQSQIERSAQGRQRAVQNISGQEPVTPMSEPERTLITLWPLYLILGTLLVIAWANLAWRYWRRKRDSAFGVR